MIAPLGSIFAIDAIAPASGNPIPIIQILGVFISDTPNIGTIKDIKNIRATQFVFLNSTSLKIDGTTDSIAFIDCSFRNDAGTAIEVLSTATITVSFRISVTEFRASGSNSSIDFDIAASIPDEEYILDECNFTGGATNYLLGVLGSDIKAKFFNCVNIQNSRTIGHYYMIGNATATPIAVTGTYVKIAGITTAGVLSERFDLTTDNRAEYIGSQPHIFKITVITSTVASKNVDFSTRIAIDGTTIADTTSSFTTTGNNQAFSNSSQGIISLSTNQYLEVFIANISDTTDPTIVDLTVIITKIDN